MYGYYQEAQDAWEDDLTVPAYTEADAAAEADYDAETLRRVGEEPRDEDAMARHLPEVLQAGAAGAPAALLGVVPP